MLNETHACCMPATQQCGSCAKQTIERCASFLFVFLLGVFVADTTFTRTLLVLLAAAKESFVAPNSVDVVVHLSTARQGEHRRDEECSSRELGLASVHERRLSTLTTTGRPADPPGITNTNKQQTSGGEGDAGNATALRQHAIHLQQV